jgi:hypothetical protein
MSELLVKPVKFEVNCDCTSHCQRGERLQGLKAVNSSRAGHQIAAGILVKQTAAKIASSFSLVGDLHQPLHASDDNDRGG